MSEVGFRLRQETANLRLYWNPSAPRNLQWHALPLPAAESLRPLLAATPQVAADLRPLAQRIAGGELPVFDQWIPTGAGIRWRRDSVNGKETGAAYFRRIPYLDFNRAGDHKVIWEINRHQHLVTLAQAWIVDGDRRWLTAVERQLLSWWEQNPPQRGINWASALEVAFRSLSWIFVLHWCREALSPAIQAKILESLYLHGRHLAANLSVYFSPNTHLLGEAVALHAIGVALGEDSWQQTGARIVDQEVHRQVLADGAHFEHSTYYHVYAVNFFLLHAILRGNVPSPYTENLQRMIDYLQALLSPDGVIPLIGDDDGGCLFHPYGPRRHFGAATAATGLAWLRQPVPAVLRESWNRQAFWWLGAAAPAPQPPAEQSSRHFASSGLFVRKWPDGALYFDGGEFGALSAGHSHAGALGIVLRYRAADVLLDPGTFSYMSAERNRFRGSESHNSVHAGSGQAIPAGPFSWQTRPTVTLHVSPDHLHVSGVCRYGGIQHRRQLCIQDDRWIWILDMVSGPPETPAVQTWLTEARPEGDNTLRLAGGVSMALSAADFNVDESVRSQVYGSSEPCWRIRQRAASLPVMFAAVLDLEGAASGPLRITKSSSAVQLEWSGRQCRFDVES